MTHHETGVAMPRRAPSSTVAQDLPQCPAPHTDFNFKFRGTQPDSDAAGIPTRLELVSYGLEECPNGGQRHTDCRSSNVGNARASRGRYMSWGVSEQSGVRTVPFVRQYRTAPDSAHDGEE